MNAFRAALAVVLVPVAGGCGGCDEPPPPHRAPPAPPTADAPKPDPDEVFAPARGAAARGHDRYKVLPAFAVDQAYAGDDKVAARRLIYRASFLVPGSFGPRRHGLPRPSTELVVDVSADRLRARFEGAGWPVVDGAEVRMRRDQPGVYVFDERGGRPLGPGQMAAWFEGGRVRRYPGVHVQPPSPGEQTGPGDLLCRLLSEWAHHPTGTLERRCGEGGSAAAFRLGPWRADRTADVAVDLPRAALRADHLDPPDRPEVGEWPDGSPTVALERLKPFYPIEGAPPGPAALTVVNHGSARALIVVGGVPLVWVGMGRTRSLSPLLPGMYKVGAMRPLGAFVMSAKPVRVPGELTFEH